MAYPTPVNNLITDSISQPNVLVVGMAPAVSVGMVYQMVGQAVGILAQNSTQAQQQGSNLMTSVSSVGCALVLSQKPS